MSAGRVHTAFPPTDTASAIFGLGVSPSAEGAASAVASGAFARLTTAVVNGVGQVNAWSGFDIEVPGIEVGDTIVSVIKVNQAIGTVAPGGGTFDPSFSLADVTADTTITAAGIINVTDHQFSDIDSLIVLYVDVTRPNATEL